MTTLKIIVDEIAVNEYLKEHGLMEESHVIEAVLLQGLPGPGYAPAAMVVMNVDGKRYVAKTTVKLLTLAASTLGGALVRLAEKGE